MTQLQSPLADPERLTGRSAARGAAEDPSTAALPHDLSARRLLTRGQVTLAVIFASGAAAVVVSAAAWAGPPPLWWAEAAVAVVTVTYVAVLVFGFVGVLKAPGLRSGPEDRPSLPDHELPVYTVLVPVDRGAAHSGQLVSTLSTLEYPADRLQILLLVRDDDERARSALDHLALGPQFQVMPVPAGPRGPAAACHAGLAQARGEFCVIYDTRERPGPGQLREAVAAFQALPSWVVCVQAELRCASPDASWLTQFSAAELAVNFGLFLRGLGLVAPLASTSSHFRVEAVRRLGAWDPDNVTPGLDLGVRIARRGWGVRIMGSVTETDADARLSPWLNQRSRWIRGCYQTWLVHMRSPGRLWRDLGTKRFIGLQLTFALPVFTTLITPLFWALILVYLVSGPGPSAAQFPVPVVSLAVAAAALGSLLTVYALMIGCMEQGLLRAVRTMLLAPAYAALMSAAAYRALFQLLHPRRRHRWEPAGQHRVEPAGHRLVGGGSVMPS